jgi:hypothetical protein
MRALLRTSPGVVMIMAQILDFEELSAERAKRRADDDTYSFWPEVACGLWSKQPEEPDPRNSPQRVLSEMALIIGAAAVLVLLTTLFLGSPSP